MRPANSFTKEEIQVVDTLCRNETLRCDSPIARNKAFGTVWRKFQAMAARLREHEAAEESRKAGA